MNRRWESGRLTSGSKRSTAKGPFAHLERAENSRSGPENSHETDQSADGLVAHGRFGPGAVPSMLGPMSCAVTFDIAQQGIATSTAVSIAPEQVCTVDCRRVREKTSRSCFRLLTPGPQRCWSAGNRSRCHCDRRSPAATTRTRTTSSPPCSTRRRTGPGCGHQLRQQLTAGTGPRERLPGARSGIQLAGVDFGEDRRRRRPRLGRYPAADRRCRAGRLRRRRADPGWPSQRSARVHRSAAG